VLHSVSLLDEFVVRDLRHDDAEALSAAYVKNRRHLEPWEPTRADDFFTPEGQAAAIATSVAAAHAGWSLPLVLTGADRILGRATLSGITRGAFQSGTLGYWIDEDLEGRGIMTAVVGAIVTIARDDLALHRVQAETLVHNAASQRVLERNGFVEFGTAPKYLRIAGEWQDHVLFQRLLDD
jgi:ribosomal-protein-alanine N-acetyltransferase